ncbi:MAG: hypothetical protein Q8869_02345, partial [Candidatus Phytoplasma australasiaticum]|nr:hypothetical protein [Candidatus Phytoplasma australasiaticum]
EEHQSQLNSLQPPIESLKSLKQDKAPLEIQLDEKDPELNRLKIDGKANKTQIKKLQDEISKIVGEIGKIKIQIGKLEATQRKYQEMLDDDENYKKILEKRYERSEKEYKNSIIFQLNELYEITSAEG